MWVKDMCIYGDGNVFGPFFFPLSVCLYVEGSIFFLLLAALHMRESDLYILGNVKRDL